MFEPHRFSSGRRASGPLVLAALALAGCGDNLQRPTHTIGGTVAGLQGPGLVLALDDVGTVTVDADGTFEFAEPVLLDASYAVVVQVAPPDHACTVANGTGTVEGDVSDVAVECVFTPSGDVHPVGGTVVGLVGTGLVVTNNGADALSIDSDGAFTFAQPVPAGATYDVAVQTQPSAPDQDCVVVGGSGTVSGPVSDVLVDCDSSTFLVGGDVTGLQGQGLVLQLNGTEDLPIAADGTFVFPTGLADGAPYDVTVATAPSNPTQDCTVSMGTGTIAGGDVLDVDVTCVTPTFGIGGTLVGLDGTAVVVENNGESLTLTANGPFTFPTELAEGDAYTVTVTDHPTGRVQHCHVENGDGVTPGADVTDILVECVSVGWYAEGDLWNQHIEDDGTSAIDASDTPCDTTDPGPVCSDCLNGGEVRAFAVPVAASCAGLTAADDLGVFDWTCDDSTGDVFVVSTGLVPGATLFDLVDFASGAFRPNHVVVSDAAGPLWTTASLVWWDNPVAVANAGVAAGTASPYAVYLVDQDTTASFDVDVDGVSLAIAPGATLSGDANSVFRVVDGAFPWFSGRIDVAGFRYGLDFERAPCAEIEGRVDGGTFAQVRIRDASPGPWIHDLTMEAASSGNGLQLSEIPDGLVERVSVEQCDDGAQITNADRLEVTDLAVVDGDDDGLDLKLSDGVRVDGLVATGNTNRGVFVDQADGLLLENVVADDNAQYGVLVEDSAGCVLRGVSGNRNGVWNGIELLDTVDCVLEDARADGNGGDGIRFEGAFQDGPIGRNLSASDNNQGGVRMNGGSDGRLTDVFVAANGQRGVVLGGTRHVASGLVSYSNADDGIIASSLRDGAVQNALSAFNDDAGLRTLSSRGNVFQNITAVGNATHGAAFTDSSARPTALSVVGANNGDNGVYWLTVGDEAQAHDIVGTDNGGYGASLNGGITVDFSGTLVVGTNDGNSAGLDCFAAPAATGFDNGTCVMNGASTAFVETFQSAAGSFVGPVLSDDAAQPDDVDGSLDPATLTDWLALENRHRVIGPDAAYGTSASWAPCDTTTCRIWDFSLSANDTLLRDRRTTAPTGDDVGLHLWDPSPPATSQGDCDDAAPGSVFDALSGCATTYVRWATERLDDGIGNDNGLCESNEDCVLSPNLGAYQGHGALVAGPAFVDGQVSGVTLWVWSDNGR